MNELKVFKDLTYIECFDGEIRTTSASLETIYGILKEEQFLKLWNELINKSNIKRVFTKELSDVEKIIYSIEDKTVRERLQTEIDKRNKDGLRVNTEIVQNILEKYQN